MRSHVSIARFWQRVVAVLVIAAFAAASPGPAHARTDHASPRAATLTISWVTRGLLTTGQTVTFSGKAPRRDAGKHVQLQRRRGKAGDWITVATPRISTSGTWRGSGRAVGPARDYWRARFGSGAAQLRSTPVSRLVYAWFYLSEMDSVDSSRFTDDDVHIGGRTFARSVRNGWDFWWNGEPYAEWNLGYKCAKFTASIGLTDDSDSEGRVAFRATLDGADTGYGTKAIGAATPVSLDVRASLRLRLTDVYVAGPTGSGQGHFWGAWGNARVLCSARPAAG